MFDFLKVAVEEIVKENFQQNIDANSIQINTTPIDYIGDCTIVVFPFTRFSKLNPEATGNFLGEKLKAKNSNIESYNVVKGFLNIVFNNNFWLNEFSAAKNNAAFGQSPNTNRKVMVEYSSPNTNKPLHLGHVRNILLGHSISEILKACGNEVIKTTLVNDRGIHICKSMLAWQKFGNGETPASSGLKGDHLVGKYYVEFDKALKKEVEEHFKEFENGDFSFCKGNRGSTLKGTYAALVSFYKEDVDLKNELKSRGIELSCNLEDDLKNISDRNAKWYEENSQILSEDSFRNEIKLREDDRRNVKKIIELSQSIPTQLNDVKKRIAEISDLMNDAQQMLLDWEEGKPEVIELWKIMNGWVYDGFDQTYKMLGVDFDKVYYESDTYLLGKVAVKEGLEAKVFEKDENSEAIIIDLEKDGLDKKILQRHDGTSVYITQDIGTAQLKYDDYKMDESIYVVGNEQDYHFKVLQLILKKLNKPYADGIYHMSYGMVELPNGKMKSREGTVVDADELMDEMIASAKSTTEELGKVEGLSEDEKEKLFYTIGMGALKYFLLKVDPKKKMLFNPAESIDFHGHTGPFIQYTHARIRSILRKNILVRQSLEESLNGYTLNPLEKKLIQEIYLFPIKILEAGKEHNPSVVANYAYSLAKDFSSFYAEHSVLKADNEKEIQFRLHLVEMVATILKKSMSLLGIDVPEKM